LGEYKRKSLTKSQIITNLFKDKFIDERVSWNLLGSKFKQSEIKQIDETFRKYKKRQN